MTQKAEMYLTPEGFLELETELNELKLNKRPEIVQAIKDARSLGDLSENAEYHSAREEQAQLESRIRELEYMLENAKITDLKVKDEVIVGCTVTIEYVGDGDSESYRIVGSLEADPLKNRISYESPIGKAVIGKKIGDISSVTSPNGDYQVKIINIA